MKRLNTLIYAIGILAIIAPPQMKINAQGDGMPKPPKIVLINGLKEDANYVIKAKNPADVLKQASIDDYDYKSIDAVQQRAAHGLQKIKQLLDGGTLEAEEITISDSKTTIGDLMQTLLDIDRNAIFIGMIGKLEQTGLRTKIWVEDVGTKGKLSLDQLEVASDDGAKLEKLVGEAQKIGFPDDYKINLSKNDYSLIDLKEMGHYVSTAGGQLKKDIEAQRAAKDAPFLKALTGDKLRVFKEEFGGQAGMWAAYGSGGKSLTTPEALASATVWYTYGNSSGIIDTYHVTGWRFQGDKLVGRTSRSGLGLKPSAAAYR